MADDMIYFGPRSAALFHFGMRFHAMPGRRDFDCYAHRTTFTG